MNEQHRRKNPRDIPFSPIGAKTADGFVWDGNKLSDASAPKRRAPDSDVANDASAGAQTVAPLKAETKAPAKATKRAAPRRGK